jgi:hypothetical protein
MPLQFLVGCSVSVINIMIHALITLVAIGIARSAGLQRRSRPRLHLMSVMVVTALVLMIAHTAEIVVWSLAYAAVGAAPAGSDLLDFAFVNYTTLGYGISGVIGGVAGGALVERFGYAAVFWAASAAAGVSVACVLRSRWHAGVGQGEPATVLS